MKRLPLDPQIQSYGVGPFCPVSYGGQYFPDDNLPCHEERPYFGHITTTPNCAKIVYLPAPQTIFDKQVWFPEPDGAYKFELEVPRFSREDISVSVEDDGFKHLRIIGERKSKDNINAGFTEKYDIPSSDKLELDLESASAKVENGLLTIFFPAKKRVAAKTIKLL